MRVVLSVAKNLCISLSICKRRNPGDASTRESRSGTNQLGTPEALVCTWVMLLAG
jgi:hypothetical protein